MHIGGHRNTLVWEVFSTITSPVFSKLVIVLEGGLVAYSDPRILLREGLRELNRVRPFKLTFMFEGYMYPRPTLAGSVAFETRKGGRLDFLDSPLTVGTPRSRYSCDVWGSLD